MPNEYNGPEDEHSEQQNTTPEPAETLAAPSTLEKIGQYAKKATQSAHSALTSEKAQDLRYAFMRAADSDLGIFATRGAAIIAAGWVAVGLACGVINTTMNDNFEESMHDFAVSHIQANMNLNEGECVYLSPDRHFQMTYNVLEQSRFGAGFAWAMPFIDVQETSYNVGYIPLTERSSCESVPTGATIFNSALEAHMHAVQVERTSFVEQARAAAQTQDIPQSTPGYFDAQLVFK